MCASAPARISTWTVCRRPRRMAVADGVRDQLAHDGGEDRRVAVRRRQAVGQVQPDARRSSRGQLTGRPQQRLHEIERDGPDQPAGGRAPTEAASSRSTSRASSSARWVSTRAASRRLGSSSASHRSESMLAYPLTTVTGVRSSCPATARNSVRSSSSGSAVGRPCRRPSQMRDRHWRPTRSTGIDSSNRSLVDLAEVQVDRHRQTRFDRCDRMAGQAATPRLSSGSATWTGRTSTRPAQACAGWAGRRTRARSAGPAPRSCRRWRRPPGRPSSPYSVNVAPAAPVASRRPPRRSRSPPGRASPSSTRSPRAAQTVDEAPVVDGHVAESAPSRAGVTPSGACPRSGAYPGHHVGRTVGDDAVHTRPQRRST